MSDARKTLITKITIEQGSIKQGLLLKNISVGQWFKGSLGNGAYTGVFLRTFDRIVFMSNPECIWEYQDTEIRDYEPISEVVMKCS